MGDNDAALKSLKMEIRSILLPHQKGCDLHQFRKEYREMIGRAIPVEKFGYRDDIELLYEIPDVVQISQRGGSYQLYGVADETTQHIQNMVASQKPEKKKKVKGGPPRFNKYSTSHYAPKSNLSSRSSYGLRPSSTSSRLASVVCKTSSFTPYVNRSSAVTSNTFASNSSSAVSRPPTAVSNSSSAVSRPPTAVSNSSSATSRPPTAVSNSYNSSAVSRPTVTNNSTAASNSCKPAASNYSSFATAATNHEPLPAAGDPTPANRVLLPNPAPSNPATSVSHYSRQFQKDLPPRFRAQSSAKALLLPPEVECRIVDVVRKYSTGLRMTDFFLAYHRNYNHQFFVENHGFSTLKECLETIPDLSMKPLSDNNYTIYYNGRKAEDIVPKPQETASGASASGKSFGLDSSTQPAPTFKKDKAPEIFKFNGSWATSSKGETQSFQEQNQNAKSFNGEPGSFNFENQTQVNQKSQYYQDKAVFKTASSEDGRRTPKSKADALDNFELKDEKTSSLGLTENIRNTFRKIISNNKHGIWAKDFPTIYEEETGSQFDLHSLGFTDLTGLVDSLPDIFRRRRAAGSRKDWIIAPVDQEEDHNVGGDGSPKVGALLIDCCIQSIRKILQACTEGIPLNDFLHLYSINCNEPLYIADLGFDCIENFLLSISSRVPLKIEVDKGCKTVFLDGSGEVVDALAVADLLEEDLSEAIPFDAASPDCQYKKLDLPLNIGTSEFIAVYVSEIINPGRIFLQLKENSDTLAQLYNKIEEFYRSPNGEHYYLHDRYLKKGAMCASLWPKDEMWYRAIIRTVVSEEKVQVFYVDYGTFEVVPRQVLRYLKEPFAKLPAQAVKASLAHLMPPNGLTIWSLQSKNRMLELVREIVLMARVEGIENGVLSVVLCSTSGDKEFFINDVLMKEGLAEVKPQVNGDGIDPVEPQQPQLALQAPMADPVQIIQAKSYYDMQTSLLLTLPPEDVAKAMQAFAVLYSDNPLLPKSPSLSTGYQLPSSSAYQLPSQPSAYQLPSQPSAYQLPSQPSAYQLPSQPSAYQLPSEAAAYKWPSKAAAYQLPLTLPLGAAGNPSGGVAAYESASRDGDNQSHSAVAYQLASGTAYPSLGSDQQSVSSRESSVDGSDIFQDDDELFKEFLDECEKVSKRYVKRIRTDDGYFFHILIVDDRPYVSSGDISVLIWSDKKPDHLLERLQSRDDIVFPSRSISEEGNEKMFDQFEKFYVKGIQKSGKTTCIIIHPLQSAIAILNTYGHPSVELRQQIRNEMESFNPNLPVWQELLETDIPEGEEEAFRAVTDDDKIRRLCIYDLVAMKDGIRIKKGSLLRDPSVSDSKLAKLDNLMQQVKLRIAEIRLICSKFS